MKKILNIEKEPIVTYQSILADLFSTVSLHNYFKPWLCSNFNQIVYIRDNREREFHGMGFFYEHQPKEYQHMYFNIPLLETNKLTVNSIDQNIIDFIINKINKDYYIRLPINMKEVKQVNRDYMHMVFVYGYDEEKKEVYTANFHNAQRYTRYIYSFEEILQGFEKRHNKTEQYLEDIIFYKNKEFEYPFFIDKTKMELAAYLNSEDIYNKYKYSVRWKGCPIFFGEEYINQLIFDIKEEKEDYRALYVLYDFMRVFNAKIEILFEFRFLNESDTKILKTFAEECMRKARGIVLKWFYYREKSIKLNFDNNEKKKLYMVNSLSELKQNIRNMMELLLTKIR